MPWSVFPLTTPSASARPATCEGGTARASATGGAPGPPRMGSRTISHTVALLACRPGMCVTRVALQVVLNLFELDASSPSGAVDEARPTDGPAAAPAPAAAAAADPSGVAASDAAVAAAAASAAAAAASDQGPDASAPAAAPPAAGQQPADGSAAAHALAAPGAPDKPAAAEPMQE